MPDVSAVHEPGARAARAVPAAATPSGRGRSQAAESRRRLDGGSGAHAGQAGYALVDLARRGEAEGKPGGSATVLRAQEEVPAGDERHTGVRRGRQRLARIVLVRQLEPEEVATFRSAPRAFRKL